MSKEFDFMLSKRDTAEVLGITGQALTFWKVKSIKRGTRLFYDIRECVAYMKERDMEDNDGKGSLPKQRTRLVTLQADKQALEVKKLKGELVPAEDIIEHWGKLLGAFRAKVLAIPPKAAQVALDATSLEDVEDHLEYFLIEALEELAGDGMPDEYKRVRQTSKVNTKAAPKSNSKRVGRQVPKAKPRSKRRTRSVANK